MTYQEKKRVINKGNRWFSSFLNRTSKTDDSGKERVQAQIRTVALSLFRREMKHDPGLFNAVERFCKERRSPEEFNSFFEWVLFEKITKQSIIDEYRIRYPEEKEDR